MSKNTISFEITKKIGTIGIGNNGVEIQLNCVSWNGNAPRYEIRSWGRTVDGERIPYKGLAFSDDEIKQLRSLLDSLKL